jgi:HK97 family phage major capsid protein
MSGLDRMRERRAALKAELDALLAKSENENRSMGADEVSEFDQKVAEIRSTDERIVQLEELAQGEAAVAEARKETNVEGEQRSAPITVVDPPVYTKDGLTGNSYFRDLAHASTGEGAEARSAIDRLVRNKKSVADEQRALGNTNATGGSGGEFAPPTWLVQDWINLLRPGRVTADLFTKAPIPPNTSSVSIPKLLTGTSVALQSTQNTALSQTDLTTSFITTGFATIGGKAVWSQQLMDQSAIPFDQLISNDLAAAYNAYFGQQVILGAGTGTGTNAVLNGLMNATVGTTATLTATTAAGFYSACNGLLSSFITTRFAQPDTWLMHPRRWYWLMAQVDSNGRPLVVPADVAYNPMGTNDGVQLPGAAGRLLGVDVYLDPNLPTNLGAGTNQDVVFLLKASDLWLFESTPQAEAFRSPYAESLGILFRLYSYAGTILNRQTASIAKLSGAGLIAPTF